MKIVKIYTDGGFRSSFEIGSFGYIVLSDDKVVRELGKCIPKGDDFLVTNNTMEMLAVISSLKWLKSNGYSPLDTNVYLWTDSQYVQLGLSNWINAWKRNGWKTAAKKPVKNKELWIELDNLKKEFKLLNVQWIEGHNGDEWNERADALCNEAMDNYITKFK